jgi:hypothetical protein
MRESRTRSALRSSYCPPLARLSRRGDGLRSCPRRRPDHRDPGRQGHVHPSFRTRAEQGQRGVDRDRDLEHFPHAVVADRDAAHSIGEVRQYSSYGADTGHALGNQAYVLKLDVGPIHARRIPSLNRKRPRPKARQFQAASQRSRTLITAPGEPPCDSFGCWSARVRLLSHDGSLPPFSRPRSRRARPGHLRWARASHRSGPAP